ncbi:MAG: carbonic anhydrase [Gammaproteobacteria bacterium]|jgi:carbonic anhydrase|nr:carbonic anhydrase [Gammaproteobacteria bacterium]MBT3860417.1 carbonic anhydrase [Gammaproteobacteria bacterium]MBT3988702.1 carbonic anhydrase [Gammaproteobacteria bacterium]MBT4255291.1 carbonic anhydrase [Gammaproteobacteria bacterium]MBT4581424.1 carbonic anhydrase [Gammaproteobacteria bacterium]
MIDAEEALLRLKRGNLSFRSGDHQNLELDALVRSQLAPDQHPFAIVLGCSDSRVPAEIVLGQGVGDLFVIRVAGNVVAPSQIGSIEFAAEKFQTRLVVVMGHSRCGAVEATLEQMAKPEEGRSPNLRAIVSRITPALEPLITEGDLTIGDELMTKAVRANIDASVKQLRQGSEILEKLIHEDGLKIIGAEYCLESGAVEFFEED